MANPGRNTYQKPSSNRPTPYRSGGNARIHLVPDGLDNEPDHRVVTASKVTEFLPRTAGQASFAASIRANSLTFGTGVYGVGKTAVACGVAAELIAKKLITDVVAIRPMVESGPKMGFLPGEIDDKIDPWFSVIRGELCKFIGTSEVERRIKRGRIRFEPIAFMRGKTYDHTLIILDEAQNTTPTEMELCLSRAGEGTKYVVTGDDRRQVDLKPGSITGLTDAMSRFRGVAGVGYVEFSVDDIVRSGFCRSVAVAYSSHRPR